jgi:hypothetical protein
VMMPDNLSFGDKDYFELGSSGFTASRIGGWKRGRACLKSDLRESLSVSRARRNDALLDEEWGGLDFAELRVSMFCGELFFCWLKEVLTNYLETLEVVKVWEDVTSARSFALRVE